MSCTMTIKRRELYYNKVMTIKNVKCAMLYITKFIYTSFISFLRSSSHFICNEIKITPIYQGMMDNYANLIILRELTFFKLLTIW